MNELTVSDVPETQLNVESSSQSKKNIESKLSISQLFKYCTRNDKILIICGLFFATILGGCLPTIPLRFGEFIDMIISLVRNINIKNLTGVNDDNTLKEFMDAFLSQNSTKLQEFGNTHPSLNMDTITNKLKSSPIGNAPTGSITFKTLDNIWDEFYKIIIKLGIVFGIFLFLTYSAKAFLDIAAFNQSSKIRSLISECIFNKDNDTENEDNKIQKRNLDKEIKIFENGIGFNMGKIFRNIVILITCYVFAFIFSWKSTLICLAVIAILFIFVVILRYTINSFIRKFKKAINIAGSKGYNIINTYETIDTEVSNPEIDDFAKTLKSTKTYGIITGILNGIYYGGLFGLLFVGIGFIFTRINNFITKGEMERGDLFKVIMSLVLGTVMLVKIKGYIKSFNLSRNVGEKLFKIIDQKLDSTEDLIENYDKQETIEGIKEFSKKNKNHKRSHNSIKTGHFLKFNKRYLWAIFIGIIASVVNGGILPVISLIISSVFGATTDNSKLLKYFSIIGGISLIGYLLLYLGFSIGGENLSLKLRKLLFNSFINRKNGSSDLEDGKRNTSDAYIHYFKKAGLSKGILKNIGFKIEAVTALIVGFTINFLVEWRVTLVLLAIVVIIALVICIIKKRKSKDTDDNNNGSKKVYINTLCYTIISSMVFLMVGLIIYLCFTAVRTEFMEFKDIVKMLISTVLTFASIIRAKASLPDINKAKEAYKSVIKVIDK